MARFLCICLSSTLQRTVNFNRLKMEDVNRASSYRIDASGKAINAARVLSQLEPSCVKAVCPMGKENCSVFVQLAIQDGIEIAGVAVPGKIRECWTLLDRSYNTTTEIVVDEPVLSEDYEIPEEKFLALVNEEIQKVDAVLLAGSRPKAYSIGIMACIARIAVDSKKTLLVDYWGEDLLRTLRVCTPQIIKINEKEFYSTFGLSEALDGEHLKVQITDKSKELDNIIIITRGKNSTIAANKGEIYEFPTEKVNPVNTTACGDSFNAGFLYEYVNFHNFEDSLAKGTWCAARNAESERPGSII
ncbi:MAG: hypothetical protein K6F15_10740 [Treponema sp.]|nr:hypothetical protein [Treponema sp.]